MNEPVIGESPQMVSAVNTLTIPLWKALGILGGAILVAIVGTAFTVASTANSDHFLLQSTAMAVTQVQAGYVRSDVYAANQTALNNSLRDIKDQLSEINSKIK